MCIDIMHMMLLLPLLRRYLFVCNHQATELYIMKAVRQKYLQNNKYLFREEWLTSRKLMLLE